jgi:hypothetical protein
MTGRQTNWSFILKAAGITVAAGFVFLKFFWFPLQDNNRALAALNRSYNEKQQEYLAFLKERKKLERYRLLGLPGSQEGIEEYSRHIQKVFADCDFKVEYFEPPSAAALKPKDQGNAAGSSNKKASHVVLNFQVRGAKGTWTGLVKLLRVFETTPLLHRIRNWTIDQQFTEDKEGKSREKKPDKLVLNMTIEVLVVGRSAQRPANLWGLDPSLMIQDAFLALGMQPTGWSLILRGQALLAPEIPRRDYRPLTRVDPFRGGTADPLAEALAKDKRPNFFLSLTLPSAQKAMLVLRDSPEDSSARSYVSLSSAPGKNAFEIRGLKSRGVFAKGTVLRVDQRHVYVQVGGQIYAVEIDQNFLDALKRPLSPKEIARLGLAEKTRTGSR